MTSGAGATGRGDRVRASDADRERATALLRDHFAAGRLTARELDERLASALNAKTAGDLRRVLAGLPEPALAVRQASPGPPDDDPLARGYRRLLGCYPAWYRRLHEEEILAVLMTAAPQGKRRPGAAEAADLLLGALRIRCQPSRSGGTGPAWRDALAVTSVLVPLIVAVTYAGNWTKFLVLGSASWFPEIMIMPLVLGALVPLALRMRRLAALAAAGLLIWLISSSDGVTTETIPILAAGLQAAALAASGGPRRALQILTCKHAAVATIATLLACCSGPILHPAARLAVIAVTGAAMALACPLGRRLLLLLAIPAYPLLLGLSISLFPPTETNWSGSPALLAASYLPSLALAALAAVAARRASTRSAKPLGTPDT